MPQPVHVTYIAKYDKRVSLHEVKPRSYIKSMNTNALQH